MILLIIIGFIIVKRVLPNSSVYIPAVLNVLSFFSISKSSNRSKTDRFSLSSKARALIKVVYPHKFLARNMISGQTKHDQHIHLILKPKLFLLIQNDHSTCTEFHRVFYVLKLPKSLIFRHCYLRITICKHVQACAKAPDPFVEFLHRAAIVNSQ
jgi:hypothetical protein